MACIRKRLGKWQVQVRRKGFPSTIRTFHKKSDALEWSRQIETQLDRNELTPDLSVLDRLTLGDIVARYRDEVSPKKRGSSDEIIVLNAFLRNAICETRLSALSASHFAAYRDERLSAVSLQTVRRQLTPVRSALNVARTEWNIPLKGNILSNLKLSNADNRRERRLREGEFQKLLNATTTSRNPYLQSIFLFALETGMRRGEILAMLWEDVDLKRRSVTIPEAKNGHSRAIPLSSKATEILLGLKRQQDKIFPISPLALRLAWVRLTKRAKIDDLHFHDLRHEAISRFFEKGLTVPEVASISGHRDVRMLLRYAHADRAKLLGKLDNKIS